MNQPGPVCHNHGPLPSLHGGGGGQWPAHVWGGTESSGTCQRCPHLIRPGELYVCSEEPPGIVHVTCPRDDAETAATDMDAGTICGVPYEDGVHIHADARCWPINDEERRRAKPPADETSVEHDPNECGNCGRCSFCDPLEPLPGECACGCKLASCSADAIRRLQGLVETFQIEIAAAYQRGRDIGFPERQAVIEALNAADNKHKPTPVCGLALCQVCEVIAAVNAALTGVDR